MATDKVAQLTSRLLQPGFTPGSQVAVLSDPIADTPMVLTLDQVVPYTLNPRTTRNPSYDQIKESIRQRGLDAPPPVTKRPGEDKYCIRNGGNTRLTILNELYQETREDRFFRFHCLFRPWNETRGEIVALTGHLAENDLKGDLLFIERALGIEKAKSYYEEEDGKPVGVRELSRRLTADGYPVSPSHISRMQDTVRYILSSAPAMLYSGLGIDRISKILALRKSAESCWNQHYQGESVEFEMLFQDVLSLFDGEAEDFMLERFQDELIGMMKKSLPLSYENILLEITQQQDQNRRNSALVESSTGMSPPPSLVSAAEQNGGSHGLPSTSTSQPAATPLSSQTPRQPTPAGAGAPSTSITPNAAPQPTEQPQYLPPSPDELSDEEQRARIEGHVASPVHTSPRVMETKQRLAQMSGEELPDFNANCLVSIPVQAGGLHPISDLWYIERAIDTPASLRMEIATLATEILHSVDGPGELETLSGGIGYTYRRTAQDIQVTDLAFHTVTLLESLSGSVAIALKMLQDSPDGLSTLGDFEFAAGLGQILMGTPASPDTTAGNEDRLSDGALVKLFRLIRLARRLIDLEVASASS